MSIFTISMIHGENEPPRRYIDDLDDVIKPLVKRISNVALSTDSMEELAGLIEPHYSTNPNNFTDEQLQDLYEFAVTLSLHRNQVGEKITGKLEKGLPNTISWGYKNLTSPQALETLLDKVSFPQGEDLANLIANPSIIEFYNPVGYRYSDDESDDSRMNPLSHWSIYSDPSLPAELWEEIVRGIVKQTWFKNHKEGWYALGFEQKGKELRLVYDLLREYNADLVDLPDEWISKLVGLSIPEARH